LDHTSELVLRLRAASFPGLIREAAAAFASLVPERMLGPSGDKIRHLAIDAPDRAATLVEWLNELVYLAEVEAWLPTDVEVESEGEAGVRIRARGRGLREAFVLVKAATLHGAEVREGSEGLGVEVTLDV
jgi:SHS2 domain-containing protein